MNRTRLPWHALPGTKRPPFISGHAADLCGLTEPPGPRPRSPRGPPRRGPPGRCSLHVQRQRQGRPSSWSYATSTRCTPNFTSADTRSSTRASGQVLERPGDAAYRSCFQPDPLLRAHIKRVRPSGPAAADQRTADALAYEPSEIPPRRQNPIESGARTHPRSQPRNACSVHLDLRKPIPRIGIPNRRSAPAHHRHRPVATHRL